MSDPASFRCVEARPETDADGAVVWLHGLGASGHDFEPIVPYLELPQVRFVFPHAPVRPVTINSGLISQGAAMALHVGLRHAESLLGIMVLSGYEVLVGTREQEQSEANRATPVLFCHGTYDPLVDVERGRRAFDAVAAGRDARWHEFPMGHEVCDEEIVVIRDWLHERFGGSPPASGHSRA